MRYHIIDILTDKRCTKHHFTADAIDESQTTSQIFRPDEIHGLALDKNVGDLLIEKEGMQNLRA